MRKQATMTAKRGLHLRLFDIERVLKNIKENALFPNSEKMRELVDLIEDALRTLHQEILKVMDALIENEACMKEMGQDCAKKS